MPSPIVKRSAQIVILLAIAYIQFIGRVSNSSSCLHEMLHVSCSVSRETCSKVDVNLTGIGSPFDAGSTNNVVVCTTKSAHHDHRQPSADFTDLRIAELIRFNLDEKVDVSSSTCFPSPSTSSSVPTGDLLITPPLFDGYVPATKVVCLFDDDARVVSSSNDVDVITAPQSRPKRLENSADWWTLVCAFLFNAMTGFNFSTYAILYVPLTELFGTSRASVGWIQSIEFSLGSVLGLFISYPLSVYGCRRVAIIGSVLIVVGGILSCIAPSIAWMYILKAIIPGVGLSMCLLANTVIVQQRFDAHRGLATGLSVIGFSVGNIVGPPFVEFLLHRYAVRGTLAVLGAIQANRIPLASQLRTPRNLMKRRKQASQQSSGSPKRGHQVSVFFTKLLTYIRGCLDFKMLASPSFALFCAAGVLQKFIVYGYIPHTTNWAMAAGLPRQVGVWAVSMISIATTVCRFTVAAISDRSWVNRLVLYATGLLLSTIAVLPLIIAPGLVSTFISVIIFGLQNGFTNTLVPVVIVDILGVENIARCFALFGFLSAFPTLAAPPFTGMLYDVFGDYLVAFVIFGCLGLVAFALQTAVVIIERRKQIQVPNDNTKETAGDGFRPAR